MRSARVWTRVGGWLALVACPTLLQAQPATSTPPRAFKSLGQPPVFKPYMAGSLTWNREGDERLGGVGVVGLYKDLVFPPMSPLGLSAEGYVGGLGSAGSESGGWDGGARLFATSRLFFLNLGLDWNARTEKVDFILAFTPYFRRGGLFGTGGNFRLEWIPGRGNSFNFGFQVPLEPHMGKTRPRQRDVRLPKPTDAARPGPGPAPVERAQLSELRGAGNWLVGNANFFNDEDDTSDFRAMEKFRARAENAKKRFREKDALHPEGRSHALETRHYHEAFDALFASAVGPGEGRAVADRAREILLDEVLLPYDRLIGRFKKPDTLAGLSAQGRLAFGRALDSRPGLDASRRDAALAAYDEVAAFLDSARQWVKDYLEGDERKVWMPLDLALRAEQHDSQEEIDGIVARALARPFTRGNAVFPTNASRFQIELLRSIHETRDYHVLWVHDFAGLRGGAPDPVAHAISTKGYLKALAVGSGSTTRPGGSRPSSSSRPPSSTRAAATCTWTCSRTRSGAT